MQEKTGTGKNWTVLFFHIGLDLIIVIRLGIVFIIWASIQNKV
jgi:hypothetical protein